MPEKNDTKCHVIISTEFFFICAQKNNLFLPLLLVFPVHYKASDTEALDYLLLYS